MITTTTTIARHAVGVSTGIGSASWIHWALIIGVVVLLVIVGLTMRPADKVAARIGGKVIGIVGRMGSGKTYMAVVIAYQHLLAGHDVRTNFTMELESRLYDPRLSTSGVQTGYARAEIQAAKKAGEHHATLVPWYHCIPRVSTPWAYFTGWEQFAELDNCIVVIDEAQLYAPSYKPLAFPLIARWKLAMARKFKLDVYWVSQHEDRVNSTLKHLTNLIYVCNAWMGASWFTAKGYEPEYVRRKAKHIARRSYRFDLKKAQLYDTLEIITPDAHLGDEKVKANLSGIEDIAGRYQGNRKDYGLCRATSRSGHPYTRKAASDNGFCRQHELQGRSAAEVIAAAADAGLDTDDSDDRRRTTKEKSPSRNIFRLPPVLSVLHSGDTDKEG